MALLVCTTISSGSSIRDAHRSRRSAICGHRVCSSQTKCSRKPREPQSQCHAIDMTSPRLNSFPRRDHPRPSRTDCSVQSALWGVVSARVKDAHVGLNTAPFETKHSLQAICSNEVFWRRVPHPVRHAKLKCRVDFATLTGGDLRLNRNQLVSLPESFGSLTIASNLCLSKTQLGSLPGSFGSPTASGDLTLAGNQLAGFAPGVVWEPHDRW